MSYGPILDEIHRIRDAHAKKFNYDLGAIYRDLKEREKASGHKYVSWPPQLLKDEQLTPSPAKTKAKTVRRGKLAGAGAASKRKRSA